MVTTELQVPSEAELHAALVERARALAPAIRERSTRTEDLRRVPSESITEIIDAGLGGRMLAPRRFGGDELTLDTMYEVAVELGRACASTAWCAALLPHDAHMVGFFQQAAQEAVWSDGPDTCIAASLRPRPRCARSTEVIG